MKEYVITRAIPIPELLCAFDIYLVRGRDLEQYRSIQCTSLVRGIAKEEVGNLGVFSPSYSFRRVSTGQAVMWSAFDAPRQTAVTRATIPV
jgi:hypothetical protein